MPKIVLENPPLGDPDKKEPFFKLADDTLYISYSPKSTEKSSGELSIQGTVRVLYKGESNIGSPCDLNRDVEQFLEPAEMNAIKQDIRKNSKTLTDKKIEAKILENCSLASSNTKTTINKKDPSLEEKKAKEFLERQRNAISLPIIHASRRLLYFISKIKENASAKENKVSAKILQILENKEQDLKDSINALADSVLYLNNVKDNKWKIKSRALLGVRRTHGEAVDYQEEKARAKHQVAENTSLAVSVHNSIKIFIKENNLNAFLWHVDRYTQKSENDSNIQDNKRALSR